MAKNTEKGQPMDAKVREEKVGTPASHNQRACWAAKTLVAEVSELFPETSYEYSAYDGRNTALDVTFDLTSMPDDDAADLVALLSLFDLDADPRIDSILDEDSAVLVSFKSGARTQDSRAAFGLGDALDVLSEQAFDGMESQ